MLRRYDDTGTYSIPHRYEAFQWALIEAFAISIQAEAKEENLEKAVLAANEFAALSTERKSLQHINTFIDRSVDLHEQPKKKTSTTKKVDVKTPVYETKLAFSKKGVTPPDTFAKILASKEEVKENEIFNVLHSLIEKQFDKLTGVQRERVDLAMEIWEKQGFSGVLAQLLNKIEDGTLDKENSLEQLKKYTHEIFRSPMEEGAGQRLPLDQTVLDKVDQALEKVFSDPDFQEVLSRYIYENLGV